jgi:hypothetical protein
MEMSVISGTRRPFKELVDGTLIMQIEIDPRFRDEAMKLFSKIDMPVAIAPLVADFERREPDKPKGGELAKLAGMWCNDRSFMDWIGARFDHTILNADDASGVIYEVCRIKSRAELDHNPQAAESFQERIRGPYMNYMQRENIK